MSVEIILPKIDEAMTKGKIIEWKKKEGDWVEKGEIVFAVETEKVTWEVEAPDSGILSKVMYGAGQEVVVGAIVAFILKPGEKGPEIATITKPQVETPSPPSLEEGPRLPAGAGSRRVKASPLAKKVARQKRIDLSLIQGSGPGGRIIKRDVLQHASQRQQGPAFPPSREAEIPLSSMRETIARRLTESFQMVPHFYISVEADAEALNGMYERVKPQIERTTGMTLTLTDLLLKIVGRALEDHPEINIQWTGSGIRQLRDCNLGLAIGLPKGLIVPVIRQANTRSLADLAQIRTDLISRAQQGKIRMDEMRGGSLTLTNLGMFGVDHFNPIINPPESCILAAGRVQEKPVALQGQVTVRKRMDLTLALDHRVLDGIMGSRFLGRIKELVEDPILLL